MDVKDHSTQELAAICEMYPDGMFLYDMSMSTDGTQAALVSKLPQGEVQDDAQFYGNAEIVPVVLNAEKTSDGRISFKHNSDRNYTDRITSNVSDPELRSELTSIQDMRDFFAYLGSFTSHTDDISHVFARKRYHRGEATLNGEIRVVKTKDCKIVNPILTASLNPPSQPVGDQICFAKHSDDQVVHLDFAYLVED